jgi:hypothetical protein
LKLGKRLTAPLSAVFLIIIAGLAFTNLQTRSEAPPLILDPQFELWGSDPQLGGERPLVWALEYTKGAGDQVAVREVVLADKRALEIGIFQDGVDDEWAYVYLSQMIDGARLGVLLNEELGVWIFSGPSCACQGTPSSESTVFGIETYDGVHTLTLIFSSEAAEPQEFLSQRRVFVQTPQREWVYQTINFTKQYTDAHWNLPERLSFSIVLGAPGRATGTHVAYVNRFSWAPKRTVSSLQEENPKTNALSSMDCVALLARACSRTLDRQVDLRASQGFNR